MPHCSCMPLLLHAPNWRIGMAVPTLKDGGKLGAGGRWSVKGLAPHDSAFVLVTPAAGID
jgi:hypothetical protein